MVHPRRISLAVVALLVVLVAVPATASAREPAPFQATLRESVTATVPCSPSPDICVSITGSGRATKLGKTSESAVINVDTVASSSQAPGCHIERRTSTLTAANGDQITLEGPGLDCGITTPQGTAVDLWTVTGGTGRFLGATGSGTNSVVIDELTVPVTSVTTFSGTLSTPDSR